MFVSASIDESFWLEETSNILNECSLIGSEDYVEHTEVEVLSEFVFYCSFLLTR